MHRFINTFEFVYGSTFDLNLSLSDFCKFDKASPEINFDFSTIKNSSAFSCLELKKINRERVYNYFLNYLDSDKNEGTIISKVLKYSTYNSI